MDVVINACNNNLLSGVVSLPTEGDFWLNGLVQLGQDSVHTPIADLFRTHHQLEAGEWLIVSPVHWQVTHNDAMITMFAEELNLSEAAAKVWFSEVSQFLAQDNLELVFHSAYYWLVNAKDKPPLISANLPAIKHQSLMPILDELDPSMYWQRLFTELQMYLASHPLNAASDRSITINGLWFWGGGRLVLDSEKAMRPLLTDDPILQYSFTHGLPVNLENRVDEETTLVAIRDPNAELVVQLEKITRRQTAHWYWNNTAYTVEFRPWYKRFFCR